MTPSGQQVGLFSPEFFADPFAFYGALRESDPVHWDATFEMWVITRYADVNRIIREPENYSAVLSKDSRPTSPPVRAADEHLIEQVGCFRADEFIQLDPPLHTKKRKYVSGRFAPKQMELLRPMVRAVVEGLFDAVTEEPGTDVLQSIARPLPLRVINELMGIEEPNRPVIAEQARMRMSSVLSLASDRMVRSAQGFADTAAFLSEALDQRLAPGCPARDDVLNDLVRAEQDSAYTRNESHANAMLLIDAGHETTVQLVSNATLSLLRSPEEWARVKSDPDAYLVSATEECLRFDPPLHAFRRIVARDVELGGRRLRAGDRIHGVIASANRDPRNFQDAERFDVGRRPNSHLAFGAGAHYCLGQYLARMEGQEYIRALAGRTPDVRLASDDVSYFQTPRVRSITSLPVVWR